MCDQAGSCSQHITLDDVSSEVDKLEWWKKYANQLPHWSAACKLILLVQPTSAAVECVFFSLLTNSFSEQQTSALEDSIEAHIMLQYNYRQ